MEAKVIDPTDPVFAAILNQCPSTWQGDHGFLSWAETLYQQGISDGAPVAPVLNSISPTTGIAGAGGTLTLTGANFEPGSRVVFAGFDIPSVTYNSPTSLTAMVNPGFMANPADYNVAVRNPNGQISGNRTFTVTAARSRPIRPSPAPLAGEA